MNGFEKDEELIMEALIHARKIQEYLWGEISLLHDPFDRETWRWIFQKRVDKINEIDQAHANHLVELRKRVLQQAALSICALKALDRDINEACTHDHKKWIQEIAETYCPECREIL